MSAVSIFDARVIELRAFLKFLVAIEQEDSFIYAPKKASHRRLGITNEHRTIAKSATILMIYNVVESGTRNAIEMLLDRCEAEGLPVKDVSGELRKVWVHLKFSAADSHSSSPSTYREIADELANEIISSSVARFSRERLLSGGNLDARAIRAQCRRYGVRENVHRSARGGERLLIVREKRNALAHGNQSFSECGREFTISDLQAIADEAILFVRSVLRNFENHLTKRKHRAAAPKASRVS